MQVQVQVEVSNEATNSGRHKRPEFEGPDIRERPGRAGRAGQQHTGTRTWLRAAPDCNHPDPDYLVSCCRAVPVPLASAGAGAGAGEGMASITSESQSSASHWMACRHCSLYLSRPRY